MQKDAELIAEAYGNTVRGLFANFFTARTTADTEQEIQRAEQSFQKGMRVARQSRDRALALIA